MTALLVVALGYAGLGALCAAMPRHHRQLRHRTPSPGTVRGLRWTGMLMLAAGLWIAIDRWGTGLGLVYAFIAAGCAGMLLVALLTYRPGWTLPLAVAWPVLAAGALIAGIAA